MKCFMRLCVFVLLAATAVPIVAQEPVWDWVNGYGGEYNDEMRSMAIDSQGNIYITGYCSPPFTMGTYTVAGEGCFDVLVAKINSLGTVVWAVTAGGSNNDYGFNIALDAVGNVYVTGRFMETASFGGTILTSAGSYDTFIAKLDSEGNWLWARRAGGTSYDGGWGITVDSQQNVYATGFFSLDADFGPDTYSCSTGWNVFISKLDINGNWIWTKRSEGYGYSTGGDMLVDDEGFLFVSGNFTNNVSFGTIILENNNNYNGFVAKLTPDGDWVWAVPVIGGGNDSISDITLDGRGDLYITGGFEIGAIFGDLSVSGFDWSDVFVAKLTRDGVFTMAVAAGGMEDDGGRGIAIDSHGNMIIVGCFDGTCQFGPYTVSTTGNPYDVFIACLDAGGSWLWAKQAGGTDGDWGDEIVVDAEDNIYITGGYSQPAYFDDITLNGMAGWPDLFVARLTPVVPVDDATEPGAGVTCYPVPAYPNPATRGQEINVNTYLKQGQKGRLTVYNLRGQAVCSMPLHSGNQESRFCSKGYAPGVYLIHLDAEGVKQTQKVLILP